MHIDRSQDNFKGSVYFQLLMTCLDQVSPCSDHTYYYSENKLLVLMIIQQFISTNILCIRDAKLAGRFMNLVSMPQNFFSLVIKASIPNI